MKIKLVVSIILSLPFLGITQDKDCWPGFRGNQELTGYTDVELPTSLKLLWTFKTGDKIQSSPVVCNDIIYIGSNDGKVYAIDGNGEQIWEFKSETSFEASPLLLDGVVYIGSLEGILFALDA